LSVVLNAIALRYDGAHEANALERANATSPIRRTSNTRTLPPMTSAFTPEQLHALAASLRLWALAFLAWLAETFDCRDWRATVARDLAHAERGAKAIIVLLALRRVVWAPDRPRFGHRPGHAPKGFALRAVRTNDMRRLSRRLLPKTRGPRSRDLVARARALLRVLDALDAHAHRLARRLDRTAPDMRLAPVAPPASSCAPQTSAAIAHADTS